MRNENEGEDILYQTLKLYKKHNIPIHILKKDSRFYNGTILELAEDHLILDDIKLGAMPIYFLEIDVLEKFIKKEVEE